MNDVRLLRTIAVVALAFALPLLITLAPLVLRTKVRVLGPALFRAMPATTMTTGTVALGLDLRRFRGGLPHTRTAERLLGQNLVDQGVDLQV